VAVPCTGHRHPEPAARRGGEGRRRLRLARRRDGLLHESGTRPEGRGDPKAGLRKVHRHYRQQGETKGEGGGGAHLGLAGGRPEAVEGQGRRVGAVWGELRRRGRRTGVGMAELRCSDGLLLLAQLDVLHLLALLLLLLSYWCSGDKRGTGRAVARVWGSGLGVLKERP
jgi:hypothetical protein